MKLKQAEFKTLQKEWYDKLKENGFEDIEDDRNRLQNFMVSRLLSSQNNNHNLDDIMFYNKSKEDYYRIAGHFLYDYSFKTSLEKLIWEFHANGTSVRNIVIELKKLPDQKKHKARTQVDAIINNLRSELVRMYGGKDE